VAAAQLINKSFRGVYMVSENSALSRARIGVPSCSIAAAVAAILASVPAQQAFAQEAAGADQVSEVVITGSRIVRRDYQSDSPIVTMSSDALSNTSEVGVEQSLNKMPQFVPGQNQFSDAGSITVTPRTTPGIATANLRGLGSNRTLVLLDGRRTQPANASMVVDLNTIPQAAIDNVEIITGGAGSTYGADAVSGVVNFKLKRNFQGLTTDAQFGMTERGDGEQTAVSALLGSNFAEGRGNAMIGITYTRREQVIREDVPFFAQALTDPYLSAAQFLNFPGFTQGPPGNITNSTAGVAPRQAVMDSIFVPRGYSPGDVLNTTPVYFNTAATTDGATLFALPQGRVSGKLSPGYLGGTYPDAKYVVSNYLTGARTLTTNNRGGTLQVPLTRYSLFTNAHYSLNDNAEAYVQASFDENQTSTRFGDFVPAGNQWGVTIPFGDGLYAPSLDTTTGKTKAAYLPGGQYGLNCNPTGGCTNSQAFPVPSQLATLLNGRADLSKPADVQAAANNANWTYNYNLMYMPQRGLKNTQDTYEILAGLRGKLGFGDWTYDFFASRGDTSVQTEYQGFTDAASYQALIALPNYGKGQDFNNGRLGVLAHCTTGLNPFVNTGVSQDCIDIIDSNAQLTSKLGQTQAELDVQGGLFDLPAGNLRMAAGVDYRKDDYQYLPDQSMKTTDITTVVAGQFDTTETRGEITVKEIYGELLAPVLRNVPFAKNLELNAGYRFSDYDINAGSDSTWKLTANWDINDFIKFRGGRQVANRAPNISELYSPAVFEVVAWTDHDPCSNLTRATYGNMAANANRAKVNTLCSQLPGVDGKPNNFAGFGNGYIGQNQVYFPLGRDLTQGNINLQSEKAKTWTAGVVLRSPFESDALKDIQWSVDWYSINVDGAISTATTSYVYQECFNAFGTNPNYDPNNTFCQRIIRDGTNGNWLATQAQFINLSKVSTSGIDTTFDYRIRTPFFGGRSGALSVNLNASWLSSYDVQVAPSLPSFSYKDSIGSQYGALYKYKTLTNIGYAVGGASVNLSWRHLPKIRHNSLVTNPLSTTSPTSSYELFGLTGRWSINDTWTVRGGVDNLFDRQPVLVGANWVPTATGSGVTSAAGTTDTSNYDIIGRRYYLGFNAKF
jgi:iron complex outermembrane recepter protein